MRAGVAQLVEQRFRKPQVVRSIRIAGSIVFVPFDSAAMSRRIGSSDFSCGVIRGSSECVRWHALFSIRCLGLAGPVDLLQPLEYTELKNGQILPHSPSRE